MSYVNFCSYLRIFVRKGLRGVVNLELRPLLLNKVNENRLTVQENEIYSRTHLVDLKHLLYNLFF